jgi:hypothetical protein
MKPGAFPYIVLWEMRPSDSFRCSSVDSPCSPVVIEPVHRPRHPHLFGLEPPNPLQTELRPTATLRSSPLTLATDTPPPPMKARTAAALAGLLANNPSSTTGFSLCALAASTRRVPCRVGLTARVRMRVNVPSRRKADTSQKVSVQQLIDRETAKTQCHSCLVPTITRFLLWTDRQNWSFEKTRLRCWREYL